MAPGRSLAVGAQLPWGNRDGTVEPALAIYAAPGGSRLFAPLPDSYINAGFNQGTTTTLGAFFVGYPASLDPPECQ
jgi:hypothetical protein